MAETFSGRSGRAMRRPESSGRRPRWTLGGRGIGGGLFEPSDLCFEFFDLRFEVGDPTLERRDLGPALGVFLVEPVALRRERRHLVFDARQLPFRIVGSDM